MSGDRTSILNLLIVVITVIVVLFLFLSVFNSIIATSKTTGAIETAAVGTDSNEWVELPNEFGRDETIVTTRGFAVNLTGDDDSYVRSTDDIALPDTNWTVSTWAYVDNTSQDQTVLSVNGRVVITYNESQTQWRAWYYDDGSTESYELSVEAPYQPAEWTHLTLDHNGTHLNLYRDNLETANVSVNQSSSVDAPINTSNLDGRLEESRLFSSVLTDTQRQQLIDEPIAPLSGTNRTARLMYDEPYASSQLILFTPAELQTSNVRFSNGLDPVALDRTLSGGDYNWNKQGPEIKIPSTSAYAAYPVVYADYSYNTAIGSYADGAIEAWVMGGTVLMVVVFAFVVAVLRETSGR